MKTYVRSWAPIVAVLAMTGASACGAAPPPKIVVIGLDGLTWTFLNPLLKDGQLPNFQAALDGAAYGEMETFRPTRSAILWTSVATGKTMEKHGITDWTFVDGDAWKEIERLRLVTGTRRTAATIWEILSDKHRSVDVVNWWVTYPAKPLNGVMITDRLKAVMNKKSIVDEPDLVYPPSILDELKPLIVNLGGAVRTMSRFGFPGFRRSRGQEMFASTEASRNLYAALPSYVGQDRMVANWGLHLFEKGQPDFFGIILRITDVYAHFAWRFADRAALERVTPQIGLENLTSTDAAARKKALDLVEELDPLVAKALLPAYKFADDFVGAILAKMEPNTILMIVSDHGFVWSSGGYDHNPGSNGKYPEVSPPGVIILKGPGIRSGRIQGARLFDVTPTILYALNEPIGQDMDGRALKDAFSGPFLFGKREERFVRSYGTGPRSPEDKSPSSAGEEEMLEDLRSLGYIGAGPPQKPERVERAEKDPPSQPKGKPARKPGTRATRKPAPPNP
jgi:hypothetical protein